MGRGRLKLGDNSKPVPHSSKESSWYVVHRRGKAIESSDEVVSGKFDFSLIGLGKVPEYVYAH